MEAPPRLVLLAGGGSAAPGRPRARPALRLIQGGAALELEEALADAVAAARQMRCEIERRIAQALDAFDDSSR